MSPPSLKNIPDNLLVPLLQIWTYHHIFNGTTVQKSANQKQLDPILDEKLAFNDHITSKLTTVN